eukprot:SAG11_NODE_239_length_11783_cov_52.724923_5_plen_44_part_00
MHGHLVPMIPRAILGGPEGEPHRETATGSIDGKGHFQLYTVFL